jgi:hypothetical protein
MAKIAVDVRILKRDKKTGRVFVEGVLPDGRVAFQKWLSQLEYAKHLIGNDATEPKLTTYE